EGAQGVLHAVAELSEEDLRHIHRILCDEVDTDALRADQSYDLFDFFLQHCRQIVEQEVRFVEEKDELGFVRIANLGEFFEEFAENPQQERGVNLRRLQEFVGSENVDDTMPIGIDLHQCIEIEGSLRKSTID